MDDGRDSAAVSFSCSSDSLNRLRVLELKFDEGIHLFQLLFYDLTFLIHKIKELERFPSLKDFPNHLPNDQYQPSCTKSPHPYPPESPVHFLPST